MAFLQNMEFSRSVGIMLSQLRHVLLAVRLSVAPRVHRDGAVYLHALFSVTPVMPIDEVTFEIFRGLPPFLALVLDSLFNLIIEVDCVNPPTIMNT